MKLSEILKDVNVKEIIGSTDANISGIAFNSAKVKAGSVFVCIKGLKADGHDFAQEALDNGAVAVIAERRIPDIASNIIIVDNSRLALAKISAAFYDYPYKKFKLIGITGTNGKTTATYLIKSVLEHSGFKVGLIGTNQNMIGGEIIPSHHTTPDSLELMELFDKMAKESVDFVVMEVSSHSLALDRVAACEFYAAALTNITQDHLDFHKTMEEYVEAKAKLFSMCKYGYINNDDSYKNDILKNASCKVVTYGIDTPSDIMAENIVMDAKGVEFDL